MDGCMIPENMIFKGLQDPQFVSPTNHSIVAVKLQIDTCSSDYKIQIAQQLQKLTCSSQPLIATLSKKELKQMECILFSMSAWYLKSFSPFQ